jgi:hypothetical protein
VEAAVDDQAGPAGAALTRLPAQEPAPAWCLSINEQDHRKGAKNAKCFIVFAREFLCDLRVSAVKTVFMNRRYPGFIPYIRGALVLIDDLIRERDIKILAVGQQDLSGASAE